MTERVAGWPEDLSRRTNGAAYFDRSQLSDESSPSLQRIESMSIITWFEFGKKCFGLFDARHFANNTNFPIFESHRKNYEEIIAFSQGEILLVSNDRKKYCLVQPLTLSGDETSTSGKQSGKRPSKRSPKRQKIA